MEMLKNIISKEIKAYSEMLDEYNKILVTLPKGSICIKNINNKKYFYIKYRENNKVKTDYIGKDEESVKEISNQLEYRKHIENMIRKVNEEIKEYKRMIDTI